MSNSVLDDGGLVDVSEASDRSKSSDRVDVGDVCGDGVRDGELVGPVGEVASVRVLVEVRSEVL